MADFTPDPYRTGDDKLSDGFATLTTSAVTVRTLPRSRTTIRWTPPPPIEPVPAHKPSRMNPFAPSLRRGTSALRTRMKGCLQMIGLLVGAFLFLIVVMAVTGNHDETAARTARATHSEAAPTVAPTPQPTPIPTLSVEQIKAKAERVTYEQLMRTPEKFDGKPIRFRGEVLQTGSEDPWFAAPYGWLRIQIESEDFSSDAVFVYWNHDNRILTGDTVEVIGLGDGRITYETVLGDEMTIPQIDARAVTVTSE